jgi:hypothetical protein
MPVLGGIAFFVLLGLVTWGIAAWISGGGADVTDRLAPSRFEVGSVRNAAQIVEEDGPIIFPGLNTTTGEAHLAVIAERKEIALRGTRRNAGITDSPTP